jgi:hypothetical protein
MAESTSSTSGSTPSSSSSASTPSTSPTSGSTPAKAGTQRTVAEDMEDEDYEPIEKPKQRIRASSEDNVVEPDAFRGSEHVLRDVDIQDDEAERRRVYEQNKDK